MHFNANLVFWVFVLVLTKYQATTKAKECVQRSLGACKVLTVGNGNNKIKHNDFHRLPPKGFDFKTSVEINSLENKHSFEKMLMEKNRPIGYNMDNAALITIEIESHEYHIDIHLGNKYYRLAKLIIFKKRNDKCYLRVKKYNRYTPSLPTFPYKLHLEITTNGTFSIYADGNTEPFLKHEFNKRVKVKYIRFSAPENQTDLIAFADCSVQHKRNCGSYRVDKLYGCREKQLHRHGNIYNFDGFQKTYGKGVLFDELIVVDTEYSSKMKFYFERRKVLIVFNVNSTLATLSTLGTRINKMIKSVRTEQWFEEPPSPYAVRVLFTKGENKNFLKILNLRKDTIISLNLCEDIGNLQKISFIGLKLYLDCLRFNNVNSTIINERQRKVGEDSSLFKYLENGYNFTKKLLDTRKFVKEPYVTYQYTFRNATTDWCEEELNTTSTLLTSKYENDSLRDIIERSNSALILSELKNINTQNKAIADTNKAAVTSVLTELEKISNASVDANKVAADANKVAADTNNVLLTEIRSVKASIDALSTHFVQNATTVNNYYNYNNQLNLTEFLKFIKQN